MKIKRSISGLEPGSKYYVQVRSVAGDQYSDWSESFAVDISKDVTPPPAPTNLNVDFTQSTLVATWSGTQAESQPDFLDFELEVGDGTSSYIYHTTSNSFELPLDTNRSLFGSAKPSITISVKSRDTSKNVSSGITSTANNPAPSTPNNAPVVSGAVQAYSVDVSPLLGQSSNKPLDLLAVEVLVYDSSNNLVSSWQGTDSVATIRTTNYSTRYVSARYIDIFGQAGGETSPKIEVVAIDPVVSDDTAPAIPSSGFSSTSTIDNKDITGQTALVTVSWNGVSDQDLSGYKVKFSKTNNSAEAGFVTDVPASSEDATVSAVFSAVADQTYYWWVASYDHLNNLSDWSATQQFTTQKDSTAPGVPLSTDFASRPSPENNAVVLSWIASATGTDFNPSVGIGYYEAQIASNTGFSSNVQTQRAQSTNISFTVPLWSTTYYGRVRAVDTSGNASAWSNVANQTVGADPALSAANSAQSTADGKNTVYYSDTEPAGGTYKENDIWFDTTNNDYAVFVYRSGTWSSAPFGSAAIKNLAINTDKLGVNSVVSSKINAGAITADKFNANIALVNKELRIGDFAATQINLIAGDSGEEGKVFSGSSGVYNDPNTGLYLDGTGKFSLADKLSFDGSDLTVAGEIKAESGEFVGNMTAGVMKIGANVNNTNDGVYIDADNYWYDSGAFKVGTATNRLEWTGTELIVDGELNAERGTFYGNVDILSGGSLRAEVDANNSVVFNSSGISGLQSGETTFQLVNSSSGVNKIGGWSFDDTSISSAIAGTETNDRTIYIDSSITSMYTSANIEGTIFSSGITGACTENCPVIWAGSDSSSSDSQDIYDDRSNAKFLVRNDGSLKSTKGEIGGWTIGETKLYSQKEGERQFSANFGSPESVGSINYYSAVYLSVWPWTNYQIMTITSSSPPSLYPGELIKVILGELVAPVRYEVIEKVSDTEYKVAAVESSYKWFGSASTVTVSSNFYGFTNEVENNITFGSTTENLNDYSLAVDGSGILIGEARITGRTFTQNYQNEFRSVFVNGEIFGLNNEAGATVFTVDGEQGGTFSRLDIFADGVQRLAIKQSRSANVVTLKFSDKTDGTQSHSFKVSDQVYVRTAAGGPIFPAGISGLNGEYVVSQVGASSSDSISFELAGPSVSETPFFGVVGTPFVANQAALTLSNRVPNENLSMTNQSFLMSNFEGDFVNLVPNSLIMSRSDPSGIMEITPSQIKSNFVTVVENGKLIASTATASNHAVPKSLIDQRLPGILRAGTATITTTGGDGGSWINYGYTFSSPPAVIASWGSDSGLISAGFGYLSLQVMIRETTRFYFKGAAANTGPVVVDWVAIG